MKTLKNLILLITIVLVVGIFVFSTFNQWNANKENTQKRMKPIYPVAKFNHGSTIRTIAFSPQNPDILVSAGEGKEIKVWNRNNQHTPEFMLTEHPFEDGSNQHIISILFYNSIPSPKKLLNK